MKIDDIIKKMRPVRLITLGFIFTILVGAILLSLPISNVGEPISFLDHLFMATTSVCDGFGYCAYCWSIFFIW